MNVVGSQYNISAPDVTAPSQDSQTDKGKKKVEERKMWKVMGEETDTSCQAVGIGTIPTRHMYALHSNSAAIVRTSSTIWTLQY
jgi:hypothetical protein